MKKYTLILLILTFIFNTNSTSAAIPYGDDGLVSCAISNTLRMGSRGTEVACLQKFLGGSVVADGNFGPKTKAAVIVWQKSVNLVADGIFGGKSRAVWLGNATPRSVTVLSPNGGENWQNGTTQTIKWQDNTIYPACPAGADCMNPAPKFYNIKLVTYYPPCVTSICPLAPAELPYIIAKNVSGSSYVWKVGDLQQVQNQNCEPTAGQGCTQNYTPPSTSTVINGQYIIQICQAGTNVCDSSNTSFRIFTPPETGPGF